MPKQISKKDIKKEEEEEFEVEKIIGRRKTEGQLEYKVLWVDQTITWEPVKNLQNCLDCVEEFLRKLKMRQQQGSLENDAPIKIKEIRQSNKLKCLVIWGQRKGKTPRKSWVPFDAMKQKHPKMLLQYLKKFECVQELL